MTFHWEETMSNNVMEQIRELAKSLSPSQKLMLIGELVANVRYNLPSDPSRPFRSLKGALKDLGPAPSAEDIDEARREAWANFPREDIGR
jgi:hypothetical protein